MEIDVELENVVSATNGDMGSPYRVKSIEYDCLLR